MKGSNPLAAVYDITVIGEALSVLRYKQTYATLTLDENYIVQSEIIGKSDRFLDRRIPELKGGLQKYTNIVRQHNISDRAEILRGYWRMEVQSKNPKKKEPKGRK
jgi:hypothetical protein